MDLNTQHKTTTSTEILVSFDNQIIGTVNSLEYSDGEYKCNLKKVVK